MAEPLLREKRGARVSSQSRAMSRIRAVLRHSKQEQPEMGDRVKRPTLTRLWVLADYVDATRADRSFGQRHRVFDSNLRRTGPAPSVTSKCRSRSSGIAALKFPESSPVNEWPTAQAPLNGGERLMLVPCLDEPLEVLPHDKKDLVVEGKHEAWKTLDGFPRASWGPFFRQSSPVPSQVFDMTMGLSRAETSMIGCITAGDS
ncbi:hypothetical protein VTK26DRAFT_164 [Humicola hyalothermophila]